MYCPTCGAANADANKFCSGCGTALDAPVVDSAAPAGTAPPPAASGNICPACGKAHAATMRFCEDDGTLLVDAGTEPAPRPSPPPPSLASSLASSLLATDLPAVPPASAPAPEPASPPPAVSSAPVAQLSLTCPTCGLGYPAGTRFCDQDGSSLTGGPPAFLPDEAADDYQDDIPPSGRRGLLIALIGAIVVVALGAAAVIGYRTGWLGAPAGDGADADLASMAATDEATATAEAATEAAVETEAALAESPGSHLQDSYVGILADQRITLKVTSPQGTPAAQTTAEISYENTVKGAACYSAMIPDPGGRGTVAGTLTVGFRQEAIPGKQACDGAIPLSIEPSITNSDEQGVPGAIGVKWFAPDTGRILMSGTLVRLMPTQ